MMVQTKEIDLADADPVSEARIHELSGAPVEHGDAARGFALADGVRQTRLDLRPDLVPPVDDGTLTTDAPRG